MAKSEKKNGPEKTAEQVPMRQQRSRKRRVAVWLLKAFGWFVSMAAVGVALLVIVAVIAYSNRERLVNLALERLAKDYRVTLDAIDFSDSGTVRISGLYLTPKDAPENARATRVESLEVTYDFDELRESRKVKTITMIKPTILVDDRTLRAFGLGNDEAQKDDGNSAAVDLSFLGAFADSFHVKEGRFQLDVSGQPTTTFEWEFETGGIDMGASEWITEDPMKLRFRKVEIGDEAEFGTISEIDVDLQLSPNFRRILVDQIGVIEPDIKVTPAWFSEEKEPGMAGDGTVKKVVKINPKETLSTDRDAAWLQIKRVFLREGKFAVEDFPQVPAIAFATQFDWSDFRWGDGMFYAGELLELKLNDVSVGDGLAAAQSIELTAEWIDLLELNQIESILLREPKVVISDQTMSVFESRAGEPKDNEAESGSQKGAGFPFKVSRFEIWDGDFLMENFGENAPAISSGVNANFVGITIGAGQFTAVGNQRLWVDEFSLWGPSADESVPMVTFAAGRAEFVWSELIDQKKIKSLAILKPFVDVSDSSMGGWAQQSDEPGEPDPESAKEGVQDARPESAGGADPADGESGRKAFWTVDDMRITDGQLNLATSLGGGRIPKLSGSFSIESEDEISGMDDDPGYRAVFSDVRLRNHPRPEKAVPAKEAGNAGEQLGGLFPEDPVPGGASPGAVLVPGIAESDVAFVKELTVDLTAAGAQRDQQIKRVQINGGSVKIGEGLKAIAADEAEKGTDENSAADEAAPQPPALPLQQQEEDQSNDADGANAATPSSNNVQVAESGWTIGELQVTESRVLFESLVPQIEGLEFAIETSLSELNLTGEGLLQNKKIQKIELTGIEIMDPYDGFIRVAELPTVFVEFSLAGLMNQEIEKIDLLGPNLYVGQGLFWWVEYQKKYRAQNEGATVELERKPGDVDVAVEPVVDAPSWAIKTINAHYGKIIVAPVGYPVGIVPFPFEASTNMEDGQIALKLEIPDEEFVYEFPNFKVQLFGLSGKIDFNLPVSEDNNNLVQTFRLDRAVWKQYEAEDVYLDVTYDANGIYGKFGGNAYAGYVNGQFNIYLNETGKWDAWMAGTGMDTGPLTQAIAPKQFFMEGKVSAKIVSEGVGLEFGETTGDFQILEPGRFNVARLDDMLNSLPEEWTVLKRSLTALGIETLKEFNYESGGGQLYFLNRDGWLQMNFKGEDGSRKLNLNVHDWRGAAANANSVKTQN